MKDHLPYQLTTWLGTVVLLLWYPVFFLFYCNFKIYNFISHFPSPRSFVKGNRHLIATPENRGLDRPGIRWQPSRYQGQDKEHKATPPPPPILTAAVNLSFQEGMMTRIYRPVFTGTMVAGDCIIPQCITNHQVMLSYLISQNLYFLLHTIR